MIYAENFRDLLCDVGVQAVDRSAHNHDRSDAYYDSDQRQKCAQFVSEDRLQRNFGCVDIEGIKTSHKFKTVSFLINQLALRRYSKECLQYVLRNGDR